MRRITPNLALALASLVVFFCLAEIAARLAVRTPIWLPGDPDPDWTIHQRSADPLLVYEPRPGSRVVFPHVGENGSEVTYEINDLGLREPADWKARKQPGHRRIVLVGDSIAFGLGVRLEETLAKRLEAELGAKGVTGVECVTLAVCGYDALQAVQLLRAKGLSLAPDIVVLVYNLTDTMQFSGELGHFFKVLSLGDPLPGDGLRRRLFPGSMLLRWVYGRLQQTRTASKGAADRASREWDEARFQHINEVFARHPEEGQHRPFRVPATQGLPPPWDDVAGAYQMPICHLQRRAALVDLRDLAAERGLRVVVTIVPSFVGWRPYPFDGIEEGVAAEARRLGFPTFRLTGVLDDVPAARLSWDTLHPNARGNGLMARRLAEDLLPMLRDGSR